MNEEKISEVVNEAMNPETFNTLAYLEDQPIAYDEVDIYTHVPSAKRMSELITKRREEIQRRKEAQRRGEGKSLSLTDDDEDTEFDSEINELSESLEKTKLTFKLKTVSPKLEKAITKHYEATRDKNWEEAEREQHEEKKFSDILSRAIDYVVRGDGVEDRTTWDAENLIKLQSKLYPEQSEKLLLALSSMVYTGAVFDNALTADF